MIRKRTLNAGWEFTCPAWNQPPASASLAERAWRSAQVPSHVHTDLVHHGIIADPFAALFELGTQWVDEECWSYRTSFAFHPDTLLLRRCLVFEGLDTVCEIRLNGEIVASHDNMFEPLEVDVSKCLSNGENALQVDFKAAAVVGRQRRQEYLEANGIAPTVKNFDERAFVRKAQYMFGWDWGPRLVSAGIWKPVTLVEFESRIVDVHVRQEHLGDGSVRLALSTQVDGSGEVLHTLDGFADPLHDGEVLRIAQPQLWWPAGLGEPALYTVTTVLSDGDRVLDRVVTRFGIRRVQLLRLPDAHGESFEFEINGKRLWAMGANWIPDHSMPSSVGPARVRRQLERARELNMNMLRVWGGGCYESDEFYSACDELGLMVWQDFAFACSYYPDDEAARDALRAEAAANVTRLRNHPSLVIWCGNNENSTMFESKWGGADHQPPRFFGQGLYDDVIPEVLNRLDRSRPYVASSPSGGTFSNSGGIGDQHTWDVWHGRGDWKYYADSTARFSSEFGFASAPSARAFRHMLPLGLDLATTSPEHPVALWHDKTGKGFGVFKQYVELHYPVSESLEQWAYFSQLNQRDALRHAVEHFRRSEFCRGALIWQLNDCWPVQSWSLVDFAGVNKAAAFELRRLFAPLLASFQREEDWIRLWVVLDNSEHPYRGPLKLEARSLLDGQLLDCWQVDVEIAPGRRKAVWETDASKFERTSTMLSATLNGVTSCLLLAEPREVRLATAALEVRATMGEIQINCTSPVVDLHVQDADDAVALLDNFVTLPAGGSLTLRTDGVPRKLVARSLAGAHPVKWA